MKKINFRKIALLGIATGLVLSAQSALAQDAKNSSTRYFMVAKGCPGKCPAKKASKGLLAERETKSGNDVVDTSYTAEMQQANEGNMNYKLMTEDELLLELNDQGAKLYNSLTPEGKELARAVASQMCQGTNVCKGLNACATEKNDCAGKGDCKGQGKCAFSDKNLAVKAVADKMAQKRANANGTVPAK